MTEFRNKSVWVIRNSNLDIVWDWVPAGWQGYWCFSEAEPNFVAILRTILFSKGP